MATTTALPIHHAAPWLAPLAGWSDLAFRLLCREEGAAVCCSEMVSAKGLEYGSPGTAQLLATHETDTPLVMQLFGTESAFMERATARLLEQGFTHFDVNMGCSVPKVTRTGAGAALLQTPERAIDIARAMLRQAGPARVGFKLRLGWDAASSHVWQDLARALEDAGAGWITLHPRTAKQGFTGQADWSQLTRLKHTVSIPVIASGDLMTAHDGLACLAQTGVDTVMYGRGALRDPSIFAQHAALVRGEACPPASVASLMTRLRRHIALMQRFDSERQALLKMRTIVPRTTRHCEGSKALRLGLMTCHTWDDVNIVLEHFEQGQS